MYTDAATRNVQITTDGKLMQISLKRGDFLSRLSSSSDVVISTSLALYDVLIDDVCDSGYLHEQSRGRCLKSMPGIFRARVSQSGMHPDRLA